MTFAALQTIHSIRAVKAMSGRAVTAKYENAKHDLDKVTQALQEFESHDWR